VLRASLALGATRTLARPSIANAQAKTATVWWVQGFAEEEDISFEKIVADYLPSRKIDGTGEAAGPMSIGPE
jgi:hypothetical protein